ncbi:MAG TPA: DUF1289 domain-containing protein [Novosphingobium sp.]
MKNLPSPCTGVCRIDERSGLCKGCRRTLAEIADWPMPSPSAKRVMLARLEKRKG